MGKKQTPEQWEAHIRTWREGDMTRKAYCQENDLALSSLDYWSRRLKKMRETETSVVRVSSAADLNQILPVAVTTQNSQNLKLHIGEHCHIEIPSPVNRNDLQVLVEAIASVIR